MEKEYKTFGKSRSVRLKDFDYTKVIYPVHIIIGTYQKLPLFINQKYAEIVASQFIWDGKNNPVVAWCVMPNHLHILFDSEGKEINVLEKIKSIKGKTATELRRFYKIISVWQKSYYDRILRKEENIKEVSMYILNNPVRKGIVDSWNKYPYSWSVYFEKSPVRPI